MTASCFTLDIDAGVAHLQLSRPDEMYRPQPSDADGPQDTFSQVGDVDVVEEAPAPAAKRKKGNAWVEWMVVIVVAITAALLVRAYVLQQFAVSGSSMYSTLPSVRPVNY